MKRIILSVLFFATAELSFAQLTLSGTNYQENFDNIGSSTNIGEGLPTGWYCYTGATAASLGTDVTSSKYYPSLKKWTATYAEFRNCASANGFTYFAQGDSAAQSAATDRAFSVRQTSSFGDPGAAFTLKIADTWGISNLKLSFQLQSLDSLSPRTTTWAVDYALGDAPTSFTPVTTTGTMTTGGNTFSNNLINADFGSALDNSAGPVWIRIVALTGSTGSQNRATTGIDDFNLVWDGIATGITKPEFKAASFNILQSEPNKIIVSYPSSEYADINATISDLSGRKLSAESVHIPAGSNVFTLSSKTLPSGMYILSIENGRSTDVKKFVVNN